MLNVLTSVDQDKDNIHQSSTLAPRLEDRLPKNMHALGEKDVYGPVLQSLISTIIVGEGWHAGFGPFLL